MRTPFHTELTDKFPIPCSQHVHRWRAMVAVITTNGAAEVAGAWQTGVETANNSLTCASGSASGRSFKIQVLTVHPTGAAPFFPYEARSTAGEGASVRVSFQVTIE